jgi:light-regulated signal transduction histidine kinase (bacteriophytochrome)
METLQMEKKAAGKMAELIDGLLDLSRLSRKTLSKVPVDLSSLAQGVYEELQISQPARKVEVRIAEGLRADADSLLMQQVLQNLFSNAWKYTSKVSGPARIEFGRKEQGGKTVYFVKDNGTGFDMRYVHKLFGVFQRLHTDHEFEGTGIGLATVQRILRSHGGKIWAESELGKGSTFYFTVN